MPSLNNSLGDSGTIAGVKNEQELIVNRAPAIMLKVLGNRECSL